MPKGVFKRNPDRSGETHQQKLNRLRKERKHWRRKYPEKSLHRLAYKRAIAKGKTFLITIDHIKIPKKCPVLGIPLVMGSRKLKDASPTIDEIVPGRGYIPGNIAIISWRANRLKSDATLTELKKILRYYENVTKKLLA